MDEAEGELMEPADFLRKIQVIFPSGKGEYPNAYLDEMLGALRGLTERSLDDVYAYLRDNVDRAGRLVFAKLKEGIRARGEYVKRERTRPGHERVTCDLCGASYDYNIASDVEDYAAFQISALCPRCGWNHADTEWAMRWARAHGGKEPPNYANLKAKHERPKGKLFYDLTAIKSERKESIEPVMARTEQAVRERSEA